MYSTNFHKWCCLSVDCYPIDITYTAFRHIPSHHLPSQNKVSLPLLTCNLIPPLNRLTYFIIPFLRLVPLEIKTALLSHLFQIPYLAFIIVPISIPLPPKMPQLLTQKCLISRLGLPCPSSVYIPCPTLPNVQSRMLPNLSNNININININK